jgi:hypothetical protein
LQAADHSEMHKCGLHEWVYGLQGRMTIVIFTNGGKWIEGAQ